MTNHSWNYYVTDTSYWAQDRDFDNAVYDHRISVFVSAGNGDQVSNTNVLSPAGTGTGTSFSSPFAAGFTADLLSQYTWLQGHPEVIKAMLMAGASRNIEGSALLSDRDGAGGISYLNTAYNGSMSWWSGANNSWFDASNKVTLTRSLGGDPLPGYFRAPLPSTPPSALSGQVRHSDTPGQRLPRSRA